MRTRVFSFFAIVGFCLAAGAQSPPAQKLLPDNTVLLLTIPDSAKGMAFLANVPLAQLWRDPALKAFRDKFDGKLASSIVEPLEHQLGISFSDYSGLARGQLTYALVPLDHPSHGGDHFAPVFIVDTRDHASQLSTNLAAVRKKWVEAGKTLKTAKIHDVEFTTLITTSDELSLDNLIPKLRDTNSIDAILDKPPVEKVELSFGQSGSLLLISPSTEIIEKVLVRQSGGLLPGLDEQASFQNDYAARLQDAPVYAWLNLKTLVDTLAKPQTPEAGDAIKPDTSAINQALSSFGLTGLTSASAGYRATPDGINLQIFLGAPESGRRGLLRVFDFEKKESGPPPFVPADAVKFSRMRLDIPKSWRMLEALIDKANPQAMGTINSILDMAGKDKDDKYDLKSELLANLGDDIISYQRNPTNMTLDDLRNAPEIFLVGSPHPDKLAAAVKVGLTLLVQDPSQMKEREFLGRKIYSAVIPGGPAGSRSFTFTASGGYLAMTSDAGMLEDYLRSADNPVKSLMETPGLTDAAQKAGGMSTGVFAFSNDKENMRASTETLRKQQISLPELLGLSGLENATSAANISTLQQVQQMQDWADFSLLPPFNSIAKYFYYSVWVGGFTPDGFNMNCFTPTPPDLRY